MKRILALLGAALLLLTQTGCAGRELYQRLLVHAVGVDWENGAYTVTVRSASAPGEEHEECFTGEGPSVAQALGTLALTAGREPFYAHNYLLIFGASCGEERLSDALDFFVRFHNTQPTVQVALAQGVSAADLLRYRENGKLLPITRLQSLGEAQDSTGLALRVELLDFINTARRPGASPLLPLLSLPEEGPATRGAVYFRDGALQGSLTGEEVRALLAAKGRLRGGSLLLEDPDLGRITVAFTGSSAQVEAAPAGDAAAFALTVQLQGDAVSLDGGREHLEPQDYPLAEAVLSREMEAAIRALWEATAVAHGCDVLGLGAALSRRDPAAWQPLEASWPETLPRCAFSVTVQSHISRLEK